MKRGKKRLVGQKRIKDRYILSGQTRNVAIYDIAIEIRFPAQVAGSSRSRTQNSLASSIGRGRVRRASSPFPKFTAQALSRAVQLYAHKLFSLELKTAMASQVTQGLLFIQDENQVALHKKATVDRATRSSKTVAKKGVGGLGSRKALQDITNRSSLHPGASIRKKDPQKEEFNVAEEMFLHDHQKCIEAQQAAFNNFDLNLVLPGHDSMSTAERPESKQAKAEADYDSPCCYPEPSELPMDEFSDCFEYSTQWSSPVCSPMLWDTPTPTEYAWQFEDVEFVLEQGTDF